MIFLTQSIAYFYWFGRFGDLLVISKVQVRRVAMMTLRSDQQGDISIGIVWIKGNTPLIKNPNTHCTWARGTFFPSCAVVSVFGSGRKEVFVLHTYVLWVQYSCGVLLVFWFWQEIVFGVTYVLSVQYSCAVVSVFWLWWERVLKMRTRFYKKSYWVTLLWSPSRCVYFIRLNTLLLCIFLFCIFLLYRADPQVEVQIRILLKDKYRKSCRKCEHRQSHFDFINNAYWVSLF